MPTQLQSQQDAARLPQRVGLAPSGRASFFEDEDISDAKLEMLAHEIVALDPLLTRVLVESALASGRAA